MEMNPEFNKKILKIIMINKEYVYNKYIESLSKFEYLKASHIIYESNRHPDDGVGGFETKNPYDYKQVEEYCKNMKAKYEYIEKLYNYAVNVFIELKK